MDIGWEIDVYGLIQPVHCLFKVRFYCKRFFKCVNCSLFFAEPKRKISESGKKAKNDFYESFTP